jgi:small subunit ribosomal protein S20
MPKTYSAKRALRKSLRRRERNLKRKLEIKRQEKAFKKALSEKNIEKAKEILPLLKKAIDKAAKTNVIHKNAAGRMKSKLEKKLSLLLKSQ